MKNALALLAALLLLAVVTSNGHAAIVAVPASSNIYGAGHVVLPSFDPGEGGTFPPFVSFTLGTVPAVTFASTGQVSRNNDGEYYGAEGGIFGDSMNIDSTGGLSGIRHDNRAMFLVAVFLDDAEPTGPAPPVLDFTNDGFSLIGPMLNQVFFVGDGLTGGGFGEI